MIKTLINNEWKMTWNAIRTQRRGNLFGYLLACIVLAGFMYFLSKGVWSISDTMTEPILAGVLSYGFIMMIGFIVLLGVPQVFKDMYSTTDLELLFTLPIPTRYIFWVKYMKSFVGVPLLVYLFFAIPLFIYGIATNVSILFYPVVLIILLAVAIIGLSIAYLLNLVLIQIVPASRANEFMTVMSMLSGLLVYFLFMFPSMMNDEPITDIILSGVSVLPNWVPSTWGSLAILESAHGSFNMVLPLLLLILLAGISITLALLLVEKGFRTGWVRLSEGAGKKKKKKQRQKTTGLTVHSPVFAIGKKEWYMMKRDLREWLVLMPIAMFIIFGGIGFFSGGGELSAVRDYNDISWPIAQVVILFMYTFSGGVVASSSIGREGSSVWILRTLPLSGGQIALGKLWISWLLPFAIVTFIEVIIGVMLGWTVMQFAFGIVIKAIITIGFSALGLWLGTLGAKYNPTNPQQRVTFVVSLFLLILSFVYLILASIPFAYMIIPLAEIELPANLDHGVTGFWGIFASITLRFLSWKLHSPTLMNIIGFIGQIIVSLGLTSIFVMLSAKRIDKGIKIDMVSESNKKALFGKNKSGGSLY